MQIPDAEYFRNSYRSTYWLITAQAKEISDPESLLQLPFRANCMNWVVGHLLTQREFVLALLDVQPVWGDKEIQRYRTNSDPIKNAEQAIPFHQIMQTLAVSQQRIQAGLGEITPARWNEATSIDGKDGPISSLIAGYHWHETYHCGQLEILRQLAGKNDKIV
jgi:hypothetical protein